MARLKNMGAGWLALERKMGEKILIGDNIEVMLAGIQGKKAVIAVRAPRETPVDREEVRRSKLAVKSAS